MKKKIFGLVVEFIIESERKQYFETQLNSQFSLYPDAEDDLKTEVKIHLVDVFPDFDFIGIENNTKLLRNGFQTEFHKCAIAYRKIENTLHVHIKLKITYNKFIKFLKKINNIEFENIEGRINSILFELVLTPVVFFQSHLALIHSSGLAKKQKVILLGGSGGVGKTSLSMKLCSEGDYSFVNDDIAVVDKESNVYPNLAFPKIYGYNLVKNPEMRKKIFYDRTVIDRFFWQAKKMLCGKAKVRRKISPEKAYGKFISSPTRLAEYYILERNGIERIEKKTVSVESATQQTLDIIRHEYYYFFDTLRNYENLCKSHQFEPIIRRDKILKNWEKTLSAVFSGIKCYKVTIPPKMAHQEFIRTFPEILNEKQF